MVDYKEQCKKLRKKVKDLESDKDLLMSLLDNSGESLRDKDMLLEELFHWSNGEDILSAMEEVIDKIRNKEE